MEEIWKDIPSYEGLYAISNKGKVKSYPKQQGVVWKQETLLVNAINKGYERVRLSKNGKIKNWQVHRLVALTFISNLDNKLCVNHINSIRNDNRVENLEWCTHSENSIHGVNFGNMKPPIISGEALNRGHLTEKDIIKIREKRKNGFKTIELAKEFNVTQRNIQHIVSTKSNNKKGWRQVK